MIIQPAPNGARGVDTMLRFNAARAKAIKDAGYDFIVRYIEALTVAERDCILGIGLALLAVGYSRRPGWMPSAELGAQDAAHHIEHATAVGLMRGMTPIATLRDRVRLLAIGIASRMSIHGRD